MLRMRLQERTRPKLGHGLLGALEAIFEESIDAKMFLSS
jgi:hypothetical protein